MQYVIIGCSFLLILSGLLFIQSYIKDDGWDDQDDE